MSDFNSALPIRTELTGQVVYQALIAQLGDATNPTTQQAEVDTYGNQFAVIRDISGNAIGDQNLSSSYWLQIVSPSNGPTAPGSAASFSNLAGGVYNSSGVTLTNGQQSALQLTSAGYLLTSTSPRPDAAPSTQNVTAQDTASTTTTGYENQSIITGTPTAGSIASFAITTEASIRVQVTGTWTGTLQSEISMDGGTTWYMEPLHLSGTVYQSATFTANFEANGLLSGVTNYRIRATAAWTGTATVRVVESVNQSSVYVINPPKLVDGTTSTTATVLAASTPALASNTALVVSLSPNSPLINFPAVVDTNYGTVDSSTIRTASQIGNSSGAADFNNGATDAQTLRVAANLAVSGANVTTTNPVPVTVVSTVPGTNIQSYYTTAALAAGSSTTFTYTVAATHTFNLERVWSTASGKIKSVIANNGTTIFAGFNSTANPNIDMTVIAPPTIAAGNTVTVTITNLDLVAFDVYATVEGNQN